MSCPVLDEHFRLLELIRESYRKRNMDRKYLVEAVTACEKQIAIAPRAAKAFREQWGETSLPAHTGYTQLSIIHEKQGRLEVALQLATAAQAAGWNGDWDRRIARLKSRLQKDAGQCPKREPQDIEQQIPDTDRWTPVTCLCGCRLRVRLDKIGQFAKCPSCRGVVHLSASVVNGIPCETVFLHAKKISDRGKARWRTSQGTEGFIEEIALLHFQTRGWDGLWSENDLWWTIWSLLFWDIIFARLDGVWHPQFGDFPSDYQDMPNDLFKAEFYQRRESMIAHRLKHLLSGADLAAELEQSYAANYGRRCRPVEDWSKFPRDVLCKVVSTVPSMTIVGIMHRLMNSFNENRSGLPDLLLWNANGIAFAEVKSTKERLSRNQHHWIEHLLELGARVMVARVLDES